jgi:hypothetical protein
MVLTMADPDMMDYYSLGLERDRLAAGARRIEFLRIRDLLDRFLPPAPARVLDVGGGAGVYAIPLAAAGPSSNPAGWTTPCGSWATASTATRAVTQPGSPRHTCTGRTSCPARSPTPAWICANSSPGAEA